MGGFAGDVYAGFALLARLQSFLEAHDEPLPVESVFESFPRIAQDTFAQLDAHQQPESALLVAGASVADASLYGSRPKLARFTSPDFAAKEIEINRCTAIGSGAEVEAYRGELQAAMSDEARNLLTMESKQSRRIPEHPDHHDHHERLQHPGGAWNREAFPYRHRVCERMYLEKLGPRAIPGRRAA